ncbi:MAG: LysM domain-containing protein [Actinomycetaceae bacterium]|nr:LysM domain-containing protein [Actinomycetaceae bacterium]
MLNDSTKRISSDTTRSSDLRMVLLALAGFSATTVASLALLAETWPTVSALIATPQAMLQNSMSLNSPLIAVGAATLGLIVALVSVWSLGSLLFVEVALKFGQRRGVSTQLRAGALKFASPLVKPIVRRRLATLALTTAIAGGSVPAFASTPADIPNDLGWSSIPAVEQVEASGASITEDANSGASDGELEHSPATEQPPATEQSQDTEQSQEPERSGASESSKAQTDQRASHSSQNFEQSGNQYEVKPGDSLWSITARHLGSADPSVISDGWVKIYERNRDAIGDSPNLIHPGTILNLPDKEEM